MARRLKHIDPAPDSELDRLLNEAAAEPLLLERDGLVYRLDRADNSEDVWIGYDAVKVREAIAKYAGSWSDIDLDAFKSGIYSAREQGSKPSLDS